MKTQPFDAANWFVQLNVQSNTIYLHHASLATTLISLHRPSADLHKPLNQFSNLID